ncbi:hypothetical protein [Larkinella sp.]|uniref:hypothetical protein n=1 Tax=Larkinella sp. TaxID=2034517 RepID=UPI003BACE572
MQTKNSVVTSLIGIVDHYDGHPIAHRIIKTHYVQLLPDGSTLYSLYELDKYQIRLDLNRLKQRGYDLGEVSYMLKQRRYEPDETFFSKSYQKVLEEMPAIHYGLFDVVDIYGDTWMIDAVAAIQNLGGDMMWYRPGRGRVVLGNYRLYEEHCKQHKIKPLLKHEYIAAVHDKKKLFDDSLPIPIEAQFKERKRRVKKVRGEWLK